MLGMVELTTVILFLALEHGPASHFRSKIGFGTFTGSQRSLD